MRVEQKDIDKRIQKTTYFHDETLTIAVVTLDNGFKATGESACVDPANYNKELGETLARSRAIAKLWAFFGFALAEGFDAAGTAKILVAPDGTQTEIPAYLRPGKVVQTFP